MAEEEPTVPEEQEPEVMAASVDPIEIRGNWPLNDRGDPAIETLNNPHVLSWMDVTTPDTADDPGNPGFPMADYPGKATAMSQAWYNNQGAARYQKGPSSPDPLVDPDTDKDWFLNL